MRHVVLLIFHSSRPLLHPSPSGQKMLGYNVESDVDVTNVISKMNVLENSMNAFMKQNNDQMKQITETLGSLGQSTSKEAPVAAATVAAPLLKQNLRVEPHLDIGSPLKRKKMDDAEDVFFTPNGAKDRKAENSYAKATANRTNSSQQQSGPRVPGIEPRTRKNSNIMYGKSKIGNGATENIIAADVGLVATGVGKDATAENLKDFLIGKGINVVHVELLTKHEEARTNTFKVTVKASEYEKAMNPEIWPYRVGVRHFRAPRRPQTTWASQSERPGGHIHQQQAGHPGAQGYGGARPRDPPRAKQLPRTTKEPFVLDLDNRYAGLEDNVEN